MRKWVSVSLDFQENPLCFQAVFSFCFDSKQMKTWFVMDVDKIADQAGICKISNEIHEESISRA